MSILKTERNQNFSSKPLVGATATSTNHPATAGRPMTLPRPRCPTISVASTPMMPLTAGEAIGLSHLSTTIIKADCRRPYATRWSFDQKFRFQIDFSIVSGSAFIYNPAISLTKFDIYFAFFTKRCLYSGCRSNHSWGNIAPFAWLHCKQAVTRFDALSSTRRLTPTSRQRDRGTTWSMVGVSLLPQ